MVRSLSIDEENQLLFVCKYCQVESFDINEPETPTFLEARHLDWFQWTIGPAPDHHLYVPGLRGLYIMKVN